MAILENGLESIELGATAWREILNYNFAKLLTKEQILALIQQGDANADGSVPSYLTKQEANSLYALKTELGNADLSQYLTLAAAEAKYLSKLEANSFLTQQSADNYYAKKTELDAISSKLKGWAPISGDDLTNINNKPACFVNDKGFLTFADVEGDQAFLFPQDIKKIRVYYDSTSVNAIISVIFRENGDSVTLNTSYRSAGYKQSLNSDSYDYISYWFGSSIYGCFYEIEMLEDNILLIHSYNGKSAFKVDDTLRLGICVNLSGRTDCTAGNLRVQKWV